MRCTRRSAGCRGATSRRSSSTGHKDPEKFRVFINTVLGEVWTAKGEAPEWERLARRRDIVRGRRPVPQDALFLTAGVDVQKDRVVYEVVGWGRGKRSWSIDYGEIPGDTSISITGRGLSSTRCSSAAYKHASGAR
jgi:phage terminase large subunit GpA-like protein